MLSSLRRCLSSPAPRLAFVPALQQRLANSAANKWTAFELRTYDIKPEFYPKFLALTKEKIGLRFALSPALGYWTTEIGGLNQVVHIWPYESLSHRLKVRAELAGNAAWNAEYMDVMRPMLAAQTNMLLQGSLNQDPPKGASGVYELRFIEPNGGTEIPALIPGSSLLGRWQSVLGKTGLIVQLWHYPDIDAIISNKALARFGFERKLLAPTPWSAWN